nr:hypothetical protein CFP56_22380 [Quercus suber]
MDPGLARYIENARAAAYNREAAFFDPLAIQENPRLPEQAVQGYTDTPIYDPLEDIDEIILELTNSAPRVKFDWGEYTTVDLDATKQKATPPVVHDDSLPWFIILLRLSWMIVLLIFTIIKFLARHTFITMALALYITWLMTKYPAFGNFLYSNVLRLAITADRPRNWLGRLHDYCFPEVDGLGGDASRYPNFGGIFHRLGSIRTGIPSIIYRRSLLSLAMVVTLLFFLLRTGPQPMVEQEDDWWNHKRFTSHEPIRYKDWNAWVAAGPPYKGPAAQDKQSEATITVTERITDCKYLSPGRLG